MASIYANGSKGHHKFTLTVTETSTSVTNNTSTISYSFVLSPIQSGWDWIVNYSTPPSYTISINGTTFTGTIPNYDGASTVTLKSGSLTVAHNSDGAKTLSFYFSVTDTLTVNFTCGNASANGTMALTTLDRPSSGGSTGASPTITASVVDTNPTTIALTGNSAWLIRYYSNARATMSAVPQGGAAIDESLYIIRNGSETGYGDSHTFNNVESAVFNFFAEDDRGYVGSETVTANMIDYVRLTCNMANTRPDADGDMTVLCSGNFFNASFGARYNTLTVTYSYYGTDGSHGSGDMTVSVSGSTYTATADLSGLDYQTTYSFTITATDALSTATSTESAIRSKPIFHWGENDFMFEVPVTFNAGTSGVSVDEVDGDLRVTGNLRLKGDGNFGNTLYFGDGSYCYIAEQTDDKMTIKATDLNLNVTNLNTNGNSCFGAWQPSLHSSAVSSYELRQGWYQRLGNVVTIGWMLRANINSGYQSTELVIQGIPFTPMVNSFGGGVAFNVYIGAGMAFEGWCVDTNNQIRVRLQPCNNTSAGNLQISSTCYYPNGGGTISLGGTICYVAA